MNIFKRKWVGPAGACSVAAAAITIGSMVSSQALAETPKSVQGSAVVMQVNADGRSESFRCELPDLPTDRVVVGDVVPGNPSPVGSFQVVEGPDPKAAVSWSTGVAVDMSALPLPTDVISMPAVDESTVRAGTDAECSSIQASFKN